MLSLEEILTHLEKSTGYTRQQLYDKVLKKQLELSGLVSLEGAAYLVARDLNVDLLKGKTSDRSLQIGNIVDGMRSVDITGRIFRITSPIEFKREDGSKGRVANLYIGDSTGYIRMSLWDKQVALIEEEKLKVGDVVKIKNGVARNTEFGTELRLSSRGFITQVEEGELKLPSVEELNEKFGFGKTTISSIDKEITDIRNVAEGPAVIRGNIVQIFNTDFIYPLCPECGNKLDDGTCKKHGKVNPRNLFVINAIVDDGTGYLRVVFFDDVAKKVSKLKVDDVLKLSRDEKYMKIKGNLLGKELLMLGNIRKNEVVDRLEMAVKHIKDFNPIDESRRFIEKIESFGSGG